MIAIGHLLGYAAGTIDLVKIFGNTFGDTQFKQLCVISAAAIWVAVGVTSYSVEERVLVTERLVMAPFPFRRVRADEGLAMQITGAGCGMSSYRYCRLPSISRGASRQSAGFNFGHGSVCLGNLKQVQRSSY